jgi:CDP-diacylglycerol---serine O-phosphatidyltransferase
MSIRLRLFKKRRTRSRYYKKYFALIPHCLTYCNALCGFFSITQSLEGRHDLAACALLLAILWDTLDGRVARALGFSSCFGMELDSLADAVSFCVAPAVLLYSWQRETITWVGLGVFIIYVCAGLARLARFNITQSDDQRFFSGLPTAAATLIIILLVLANPYNPGRLYAHAAVSLVLGLSFLMVSSLRLPSGKNIR